MPGARALALHAHDFEGMFRDLRELGEAVGRDPGPLERRLRKRIAAVVSKTRGLARRRVFCMEWLEPLYCSGHWVPEMVEMAGGRDGLARKKRDSARIEWEALVAYAPEVVIVMPCGLSVRRARRELPLVTRRPEWAGIPAARNGEAFLADGPSYFNGAGPRLVDGLEMLAEMIHPEVFRRKHRLGYTKAGRRVAEPQRGTS